MNPQGDGAFPKTHWTRIEQAKSGDPSIAGKALDELCAEYRYPLYCYIRRSGLAHDDAEDALQDFFAKLIRLETFAGADAARGRLRNLLVTSLRRFLSNWQRDRPHRQREVSTDAPASPSDAGQRYQRERFLETETPERIFEREWGHELLARVIALLATSYERRGRTAVFDALPPALSAGGTLRGADAAAIAASLGISENALRATLSRLLAEYRATLEEEVLRTVTSPGEVEDEIAHLLSVFRRD